MSTKLIPALSMVLLLRLFCGLANCAPYWGSFSRDNCIKPGFRKYHARLWGIEGEWEPACQTMPAFVQGVYFPKPDRCIHKGIFHGEWGEFFVREKSCDPWWHHIGNYKCEKESFHKYSSWLEHIEGDWTDWCQQTSAVVRGIFFSKPTSCYRWFFHEWGDFEVPDICCGSGPNIELRAAKQLQPLLDSEAGYNKGLCVVPSSFAHWLELTHDAVELWKERERQICMWPIAAAPVQDLAARHHSPNTAIVDSNCILKVFAAWRRDAAAGRRDDAGSRSSDDEDECESNDEMPPFPIVSDQVTDLAGAVAAFGEAIIRTSRLLPYLFRTTFSTVVSVSMVNAAVRDFYAAIFQRTVPGPGPEPVQAQYLRFAESGVDPSLPWSLFRAMLVPTTPAHVVMGSGGIFPVGTYATIHVGQPRTASAICTARFTGCTLAIGWDRVNRVLYMGHVQPSETDPTLQRASISNKLRMRGGFENVALDRDRDIYFFGGDSMYYSYGTESANVIGFIYDTHVEMLFQVTSNDNENILKSWIIFYCADDD